jgi:hypothetical protein
VTARRDRAGNDALALPVALDRRSKFLDNADGLMTDGQAARDWIFALQDMYVRAADRRGGDADQRVQRTDVRDGLFIEHNAVRFDENRRLHLPGHDWILLFERVAVEARKACWRYRFILPRKLRGTIAIRDRDRWSIGHRARSTRAQPLRQP